MSLEVGSVVGGYEIISAIGQGGVGKVFKVRHNITGRVEAMKLLLSDYAEHDELVKRFLREIKIQATLDHPNIASVLNALEIGGSLVMIMEFVEGASLDTKIVKGPLPLATTLDYSMQALSALDYAHAHGVTHRDIKPENMLVTRSGALKLADFGCARTAADPRLTGVGAVLGSLYYMSPEQAQGKENIDERTDVYSMGAVVYELTTGRTPFEGDQPFQLMMAHVSEEPRPPIELDPSLPQGLSDAILRALSKAPAHRFQSAQQFLRAIENVSDELSLPRPKTVDIAPEPQPLAVEFDDEPAQEDEPTAKRKPQTSNPSVSVSLFVFFFFFFFFFFFLIIYYWT